MSIVPTKLLKQILAGLLLPACVWVGAAFAFDSDSYNREELPGWAEVSEHGQAYPQGEHWEPDYDPYGDEGVRQDLRSIEPEYHWVQNNRGNFRSKAEVVREVKRRYNAKVLKISLNEQRAVYNVRMLMPSGKVRNIQVSARR
ncbi:MAG: hypothetical protein AAF431_18795 [Pseudomonadota bacterium]